MVTLHVKPLTNLFDKTMGLIPAKKAYPVLLKTRFGIHTLGMKFPIDAVVLDKKNTIMKLKKNLKPNNVFLWNPRYNTVLELPTGTIDKYTLKENIQIKIVVT